MELRRMGRRKGRARLAPAIAAALALATCGPTTPRPVNVLGDDAVTVASFNFAESVLLAEIYAQALEARGIGIERRLNLGTRELVLPALHQGLVELVPEYSGSAVEFVGLGRVHPTADLAATRERLEAVLAPWAVRVLESAPAEDANGLVVSEALAAEHELAAVSDLVPIAGELTLGGPPECPSRPLCVPGFESVYGLTFGEFVALDVGGPLTVDALRTGQIDVAVLFTTDAVIRSGDFVLLEDDRGLQPAENVTPIVRQEILQRHGQEVAAILDGVSAELTTETLQELNAVVASGRETARAVAGTWLRALGLVAAG